MREIWKERAGIANFEKETFKASDAYKDHMKAVFRTFLLNEQNEQYTSLIVPALTAFLFFYADLLKEADPFKRSFTDFVTSPTKRHSSLQFRLKTRSSHEY